MRAKKTMRPMKDRSMGRLKPQMIGCKIESTMALMKTKFIGYLHERVLVMSHLGIQVWIWYNDFHRNVSHFLYAVRAEHEVQYYCCETDNDTIHGNTSIIVSTELISLRSSWLSTTS